MLRLASSAPDLKSLSYLTLEMLTLGFVSKHDRHSRVHVSTKNPFVGARQKEHRREDNSKTTCR